MSTVSAHHWLKRSGAMLAVGAGGFAAIIAGSAGTTDVLPGISFAFRFLGLLVLVGSAMSGFVFAARAYLQERLLGFGGLAVLLMVFYGLALFFIAMGLYVTIFVVRGD